VVAHSESIEETAAVFSRYLKMVWENPRYSRILLGLPGILMIILGILYITGWINYTGIAFLIVCGSFLLIKGFRIDKATLKFYRFVREYSPPPLPIQIANYSTVAGVLLGLVGCYLGGVDVANSIPQPPSELGQWLALLPSLLGWFISGSIALIVVGVSVVLAGRAIRWYFERDPRLWRTIVIMVAVVWSWPIFSQASQILIDPRKAGTYTVGLVATIIIGIPLTVAAVLTTFLLHRKYARFFREKKEEIEEIGEG
jgi:putative membrane protein